MKLKNEDSLLSFGSDVLSITGGHQDREYELVKANATIEFHGNDSGVVLEKLRSDTN